MTNCPNCAALLKEDSCKCEYCGSHFFDFCGINIDELKPLYLRLKYNNQIAITKVIPGVIEFTPSTDENPKFNMEFTCLPMDYYNTVMKIEEV